MLHYLYCHYYICVCVCVCVCVCGWVRARANVYVCECIFMFIYASPVMHKQCAPPILLQSETCNFCCCCINCLKVSLLEVYTVKRMGSERLVNWAKTQKSQSSRPPGRPPKVVAWVLDIGVTRSRGDANTNRILSTLRRRRRSLYHRYHWIVISGIKWTP